MLRLIFVLFTITTLSVANNDKNIVCRDEEGNAVDWYYLYKLPKEHNLNMKEEQSQGLNYLYISSETTDGGWKLSTRTINDSSSFPGQTLANVLTRKQIVLIAYNDEPPNGPVSFSEGHTKGVIASDNDAGFWLIHSVPKYPEIGDYKYPATGMHYGQSFLCLSLNSSQIDLVGKQQLFNQPNIYHAQLPREFEDAFPNLVDAANKSWQQEPPYWNYEVLETLNKTKFGSFAKSEHFQKELYEDWVAPTLSTGLYVESWRHGPRLLPSNCTKQHYVFNVQSIISSKLNINFNSTKDHSKWCVAEPTANPWICVGDINRSEHQLRRGGGTVCQLSKKVALAYSDLIAMIELC